MVGHADISGLEAKNMALSQQRAGEILSLLISSGIDPAALSAVGVGSKQPVRDDSGEDNRAFNRSTTFRTILKQFIEEQG